MSMPQMPSPKQQFKDQATREHQTTMKVLKAYPHGKLDLRPSPKSKTAKELAWTFAIEQALAHTSITTGFDWSKPFTPPAVPESYEAILNAVEHGHAQLLKTLEHMPDEKLFGTVKFPSGPKMMADVPVIQFLWFLLSDEIHHRGQFSVYLRMADGKLPSIYGPTADEPWW